MALINNVLRYMMFKSLAVDLTVHSYRKRAIHNNRLILASTCKCCVLFFHLQLLEMKVEWTGKGLDSVCVKSIGFCTFIAFDEV